MSRFEQFWAAYPRKTHKGAARRMWLAVEAREPDLLTKCLTALSWQVEQASWQELDASGVPRWIPHPATYLNGERYEDEMPAGMAARRAERAAEQARVSRLTEQYQRHRERADG